MANRPCSAPHPRHRTHRPCSPRSLGMTRKSGLSVALRWFADRGDARLSSAPFRGGVRLRVQRRFEVLRIAGTGQCAAHEQRSGLSCSALPAASRIELLPGWNARNSTACFAPLISSNRRLTSAGLLARRRGDRLVGVGREQHLHVGTAVLEARSAVRASPHCAAGPTRAASGPARLRRRAGRCRCRAPTDPNRRRSAAATAGLSISSALLVCAASAFIVQFVEPVSTAIGCSACFRTRNLLCGYAPGR